MQSAHFFLMSVESALSRTELIAKVFVFLNGDPTLKPSFRRHLLVKMLILASLEGLSVEAGSNKLTYVVQFLAIRTRYGDFFAGVVLNNGNSNALQSSSLADRISACAAYQSLARWIHWYVVVAFFAGAVPNNGNSNALQSSSITTRSSARAAYQSLARWIHWDVVVGIFAGAIPFTGNSNALQSLSILPEAQRVLCTSGGSIGTSSLSMIRLVLFLRQRRVKRRCRCGRESDVFYTVLR